MLNHYVAVYVPLEAHRNKPGIEETDTARVLETVQRRLASAFGGFTQYNATGGWVDGSGNLIVEPIGVVKAYHDGSEIEAAAIAGQIAEYVKHQLDQDCVTLETQHGLTFI